MTEEWDPFDYLIVGGAFLTFLLGPAVVFAIAGDYLEASIAILSPFCMVLMFEAGFYQKLRCTAIGGNGAH